MINLFKQVVREQDGPFKVQYVTRESLYESVQREGDPNFPNQTGIPLKESDSKHNKEAEVFDLGKHISEMPGATNEEV